MTLPPNFLRSCPFFSTSSAPSLHVCLPCVLTCLPLSFSPSSPSPNVAHFPIISAYYLSLLPLLRFSAVPFIHGRKVGRRKDGTRDKDGVGGGWDRKDAAFWWDIDMATVLVWGIVVVGGHGFWRWPCWKTYHAAWHGQTVLDRPACAAACVGMVCLLHLLLAHALHFCCAYQIFIVVLVCFKQWTVCCLCFALLPCLRWRFVKQMPWYNIFS